MERYICIHGHFYQPPRENPWLEDLELQDSADPQPRGRGVEEARLLEVALEGPGLEYALRKAVESLAARFRRDPHDLFSLEQLAEVVALGADLPFEVNLWKVQNIYYEMLNSVYPHWRLRSEQGQEEAVAWVRHFVALGERLSVSVP